MSEGQDDEYFSSPPWNFSWVVPKKLAGMSWPQTSSNVRYIYEQGIHHLVTLSPEKRPPLHDKLFDGEMEWTEIAIEEFEAPTLEQILEFIDICKRAQQREKGVGVHCRMGRGRTGVMLACYLVHFLGQPPQRAVINVRLMRPGSVETLQQELVVKQYHDFLRMNE